MDKRQKKGKGLYLSKYIFISIVLFLTSYTPISIAAPVRLNLERVDSISPLKSDQGYLLINLKVSSSSPSIEFYRLNVGDQTYLRANQKFKKNSKKFILDLKNKSAGYYFCKLSPGLYQITNVNVPYFDFPFKLNTDNARAWRFSIVEGKVNYIGKLEIDKERSSKNVNIKLLNRIATELDTISTVIEKLSPKVYLRSGTGVRDDFYDAFSSAKE